MRFLKADADLHSQTDCFIGAALWVHRAVWTQFDRESTETIENSIFLNTSKVLSIFYSSL